jgi:hypothetical protein
VESQYFYARLIIAQISFKVKVESLPIQDEPVGGIDF